MPRWREAAAKPPHHAKPPRRRLNEHTKKLDYYTGNYDSYVRERSIRDDEQQRKYDAEQRDIAEIKDFIARCVSGVPNRVRMHSKSKMRPPTSSCDGHESNTATLRAGSATAP